MTQVDVSGINGEIQTYGGQLQSETIRHVCML